MINRYASLRQGLVGAWCPSLNVGGSLVPDLLNKNNATGNTGVSVVAVHGKKALAFNGTSGILTFGNASFVGLTTITVSYWFQRANLQNIGVQQGNSETSRLFFAGGGDTNIYIGGRFGSGSNQNGGEQYSFSDISQLTGSGMHHAVFTLICNSAVAVGHRIWVNGVERTVTHVPGLTTTVASIPSFTTPIQYGERFTGSGTEFRQGSVDDIRVYNRALTPQEIRLLYTGGRGVGLAPERIKHRRKTSAAATNRRRRIICGANC